MVENHSVKRPAGVLRIILLVLLVALPSLASAERIFWFVREKFSISVLAV